MEASPTEQPKEESKLTVAPEEKAMSEAKKLTEAQLTDTIEK